MFTDSNKRKFLFKCSDCEMIISANFDDEDDIKDIEEDKMTLECVTCGGKCHVLRD